MANPKTWTSPKEKDNGILFLYIYHIYLKKKRQNVISLFLWSILKTNLPLIIYLNMTKQAYVCSSKQRLQENTVMVLIRWTSKPDVTAVVRSTPQGLQARKATGAKSAWNLIGLKSLSNNAFMTFHPCPRLPPSLAGKPFLFRSRIFLFDLRDDLTVTLGNLSVSLVDLADFGRPKQNYIHVIPHTCRKYCHMKPLWQCCFPLQTAIKQMPTKTCTNLHQHGPLKQSIPIPKAKSSKPPKQMPASSDEIFKNRTCSQGHGEQTTPWLGGFEFKLCWMVTGETETARNGPTLVFLGH